MFIRTSYHSTPMYMRLTITGAPDQAASPRPLATDGTGVAPHPGQPPLVTGDQQLVPAWARPVHLACPPHTCTRGKNGKPMVSEPRISRSLNESLLLDVDALFVPPTCSHFSAASPDCQWMVLGNALSLCLTRCGPYDTRYHSRQTHTK